MENTINQFAVLLYCVYSGALAALIYDLIGLLRTSSALWTAVLDTLFWVGALLVCGLVLMRANGLQPRVFALLGFAAGFTLYRLTLGRMIGYILSKVKSAALWIIYTLLDWLA